MATLQDLEVALLNAHKAGDGRAAQMLADEIRNMRQLSGTGLGKDYQPRTSLDPENPGPVERLGRGFTDFAVAGQRLTLPADKAQELTRRQDEEIALYEKGRGKDAGFDAWRFAGQNLPSALVSGGMAMGAERALGTMMKDNIPRMTLGAAQGTMQGATTYTPEGQSQVIPVALGAGAGALAPLASNAIAALVAKATQFGREAAAKLAANPESIARELAPILEQQGVRWGDLTDDVRNGMVVQARKQMAFDGQMNPEVIARKAEMEEVLGPAGPTRGQVTRDPKEWTWERNTQKLPRMAGPGEEDLTDRFRAQLQKLQEKAQELITSTGARAQNAYQAGASATDAVQQKMKESGTVVDELYAAFRKSGAGGVQVKAAPIADTLGRVADEYGVENIAPAVRARLESFGLMGGKQTKVLTVDEAEKLRKLIGNNTDPSNKPQMATMQILKRAVDEAMIATEAPGIPALQTARRAAAERFAMRDSGAGVTAAAEGGEPDNFFRKYVLNGDVADLRGLKATLTTGVTGGKPTPGMQYEPAGAQGWKDLKGQVLEHAFAKATSQGEGTFSGKAFRKALDEIGDERLKVLFEPAELAQIRKLDRTAYNATAEPPLAAVNHSNTASAGAQFMGDATRALAPRLADMATGIPLIGKMAVGAWSAGDDVARQAELRRRISGALSGDVTDADQKRRRLAELISGRIDPYMVSGAAGYGAYKSR